MWPPRVPRSERGVLHLHEHLLPIDVGSMECLRVASPIHDGCISGGFHFLAKRRRRGAWIVMRVANAFFRLARNPVEAIVHNQKWREWEATSFDLLHGPEFPARRDSDGNLSVARLPGVDLSQHLRAGTLLPAHLFAAGREMLRAHGISSDYFRAGWSHGDPHTGNFVFDAEMGRARLVDFEMRHHRTLPERQRHADDLLVLLQDVSGRCSADAWLPLARALLEGYGRGEIITALSRRLEVPSGIPRLWWGVRTTWMTRHELESRMRALAAHINAGWNAQSASGVCDP